MAYIRRRGKSYRAEIDLKGVRDSATFDTLAAAKAWAAKREYEINAGARGIVIDRSVRQVLERYRDEVTPTHRGERWERIRIEKILREIKFANRAIAEVGKADINAWKLDLMKRLKPSSARREYGVLRMIFSYARDEWGYLTTSPFESVDPPPAGRPRKRRAPDAEFNAIIEQLGYTPWNKPETTKDYVALAMFLARETAMREGEILSLDEESYIPELRIVHLDRTKNGDERDIPLSTTAMQVLEICPTFPVHPGTFYQAFRDARIAAGVEGLTFHDLRREATSRLAKKLPPLELAKVTGHRDLKVLISTYYAPNVTELADLLD